MKKKASFPIFILALAIAFFGCEQKNSAPSVSQDAISSSLTLLKAKPAGAVPISQARLTAKPGDSIVLSGEIGGRKNDTFTPDLATFFLADPGTITNCAKKHAGESACPTPWDYCCEPKDKVLSSLALIQVKSSGSGQVLSHSLKGWSGLKELSQVTVVGSVDPASSSTSFIVHAREIYIER